MSALSNRFKSDELAVDPALINPVIEQTLMTVPLSAIDSYDRNPRRKENPRKEDIKQSIAEGGLLVPLNISRKEGELRYFVYKGGNTRLECLQELFAETNDPRFLNVRCIFEPFASDFEALAGHGIENELRGELSFIDRALWLAAVKAEAEDWHCEPLSLREFQKELRRMRLPLSLPVITYSLYAARIYKFMPLALDSGLGRPQIASLSKLERAGFNVWGDFGQKGDAEFFFGEIFGAVLVDADRSDGWVYQDAEDLLGNAMMEKGLDGVISALNLAKALRGEKLTSEGVNTVNSSGDSGGGAEGNTRDIGSVNTVNSDDSSDTAKQPGEKSAGRYEVAKKLLLQMGADRPDLRVVELPVIYEGLNNEELRAALIAGEALLSEREALPVQEA